MNSKTQHTPGPWTKNVLRVKGGKKAVFNSADYSRFAECWITLSGTRDPEGEANARLIAAAPTMYEGIGDFLAAYDRARIGDWDHWKLIDWLGEQVARLRTVYAKAEGRADG